MSLLDGNLKIFKGSKTFEESVPAEMKVLESKTSENELKTMFATILMEHQQHDLLMLSRLGERSQDELRESVEVTFGNSEKVCFGVKYHVKTVLVSFDDNIMKKQSLVLMVDKGSNSDNESDHQQTYNILIITKASPKVTELFLSWLRSELGSITNPAKFSSLFLKQVLYFLLNGLPTDKTRVGDIELCFKTTTQGNSLNDISVEIPNSDINEFESYKDKSVLESLFSYLIDQTAIDFGKLDVTKLKCGFLMISSDGKLRLSKGIPRISATDVITFTVWDLFAKVYENI